MGVNETKSNWRDTYYEKQTNTESTRKQIPKPKKLIQIPGSFFPQANYKDALWITMTARQLKGMNTAGRGGTLRIGATGTQFKFLAPETIIESHNHDWEAYESIQAKLMQKIITYKIGWNQVKDIGRNVSKEVHQLLKANKIPTAEQLINSGINSASVGVPKFKIDTPLVYKNSQRRNWQFTFVLADAYGGKFIMWAVKELEKYAAPSGEKDVIAIEFPWVFELRSIPEGLINCEFAAMTSIQPSWNAPYIKGRPSRCELTLSFIDMSPLFAQTIERGGIINVINSEATNPAPVPANQIKQSTKSPKRNEVVPPQPPSKKNLVGSKTPKPTSISPPAIAGRRPGV